MTLNELCKEAHALAVKKGFWDCPFFGGGTCCNDKEFPNGTPTEISGDYCSKECKFRDVLKRNTSELLMLIVSELGEACEALRKNYRQKKTKVIEYGEGVQKEIATTSLDDADWIKDSFEDELADAVIRIADLAKSEGIDLEWQITKKMEYNKTRPYKHNKKF